MLNKTKTSTGCRNFRNKQTSKAKMPKDATFTLNFTHRKNNQICIYRKRFFSLLRKIEYSMGSEIISILYMHFLLLQFHADIEKMKNEM